VLFMVQLSTLCALVVGAVGALQARGFVAWHRGPWCQCLITTA